MLLMAYSSPEIPKNVRPIADEWEWQYKGLCRTVDPEMFFLDHGDRAQTKRKKELKAIKICQACPVISECLAHALKVPEMYGVWGGTTVEQRLFMLKRNDRAGRPGRP